MRRIVCVLLCVIMVLSLFGCNFGSENDQDSNGKTTLMIYMIGSDLESRAGEGTDDMQEMLESQVDLSCNNVLVYAGGANKWQNDYVAAESGHTILSLTENGFQTVETHTEASMGEADTLAYFLNYAYDNYKASDYALIMWDHGSGPLIGYGKDMLHENDTLTLTEMRSALEASPFKDDNKLAWVGFDACLMASVELACIWQNHARYMIASQEVEPAFGWNYSFMQYMGKVSSDELAGKITSGYLDSCVEYYKERGYSHRDTTLSCIDLDSFTLLRDAVEALFKKATGDVSIKYNKLASMRVNTRALGRATTGSEYDLIDIVDLAENMKEYYPNEAQAVIDAANATVVYNATNAEECCGLSIYYPFYNKSYFKKSWSDVYHDLGVLPSYVEYLDFYTARWLQSDLLGTSASSRMPSAGTDGEFVLELTDQQAENYVSARYYVLQRDGHEVYHQIFSSSNVVKTNNKLIASFDGNIIYAKNNFNEYWIAAIDEHDTVGDYTRYSTYLNLTNGSPLDFMIDVEDDIPNKVQGCRYHISVNNLTNEVGKASLVPYDEEVTTELLVGGKQEDIDLSEWSEFYFLQERRLYLARDENNVIQSLDKWYESGALYANTSRVCDGIEFVVAPIPDGEYYLIYEIEDAQGNRYCSELLPIESEGASLPDRIVPEKVEASWTSGDRVKLFEREGIVAYLTTERYYGVLIFDDEEDDYAVRYALQIENKNSFDIVAEGYDVYYNDAVYCDDGLMHSFLVPSGQTVAGGFLDFGDAEALEKLDDLRSIQFSFSVVTATGDRTLIYEQAVDVELSDAIAALRDDGPSDWYLYKIDDCKTDEAVFGMQAKEQVLFERNGLKVTLLGLGGNGNYLGGFYLEDGLIVNLKIENKSAETKNFRIVGVSFDNMFLNHESAAISVPPGKTVYNSYNIHTYMMEEAHIASASSVRLWVSHTQFDSMTGAGGFAEVESYKVNLSKSGAKASVSTGSNLIYNDGSVKIYLYKSGEDDYGDYNWECVMVNTGNRGVMLTADLTKYNGNPVTKYDDNYRTIMDVYMNRCPAGHTISFVISRYESLAGENSDELSNITLVPRFYDLAGEALLYTGSEFVLNK